MEDTAKYLIHATFTADGVVERSDVVGAIFGQTEGLLGEQLDLRELQQSSKIGRIDVEVDVTRGQTEGTVTIASGLDRVATATLAASLETMTRIGPCQARCEVSGIEDVRAAKRREVVERAKELLNEGFDDTVMSSDEILREVREHVRVEDVTEYDGLPAGPRVGDSDAIIVVEGRSDVLQLLKYGIKNAVAVEGTDVPEAIANLTAERTVTAFLDGDRGGDLILRELASVGDVDYVALAPADKSVEDLAHHEVFEALREKVPYETVAGASDPREAVAATDGSTTPAPEAQPADETGSRTPDETGSPTQHPDGPDPTTAPADGASPSRDPTGAATDAADAATDASAEVSADAPAEASTDAPAEASADAPAEASADAPAEASTDAPADAADATPGSAGSDGTADDARPAGTVEPDDGSTATSAEDADDASGTTPSSLREHAAAIVDAESAKVVLLDGGYDVTAHGSANEAFELIRDADTQPHAVVLDGELSQRVLDVAAQRGVDHVIAAEFGDFVKRPTSVRIRTAADLAV